MADRFPLVVDSSNFTIEEISSGDNLNLDGSSIVNATGIAITGTTASTSNVTGALTVSGGVGVASSAFFGSDIYIDANGWPLRVGHGAYTPGTTTDSGTPIERTNLAFGQFALESNTTGFNNIAVGSQALRSVTTGSANVAVGELALTGVTTGTQNTAVGQGALQAFTGAGNNAAFGFGALQRLTTGSNNTALGPGAGSSVTTGTENTLVGSTAGTNMVGGSLRNTAVGQESLLRLITGDTNTAIGEASLTRLEYGDANTAVGERAMYFFPQIGICTGNTAVGSVAGMGLTNNTLNNVVIGYNAGGTTLDKHGENNIIIGYNANVSSASTSNEITLGNSSITNLRCNVTTISALSDERDKKNIEDLSLGLEFINSVRPVKFEWNQRDGGRVGGFEAGFIAQELLSSSSEYEAGWLGLVSEANPDRLEASPGKLLPVLVKAVQELTAKNAELEARLAALENA